MMRKVFRSGSFRLRLKVFRINAVNLDSFDIYLLEPSLSLSALLRKPDEPQRVDIPDFGIDLGVEPYFMFW